MGQATVDMIKNIIASEIYFDKFHFYELKQNEYAGVIKNFESYITISNHLLNRSIYPILLENLFTPLNPSLDIKFKYSYFNLYFEKNLCIEDLTIKKNTAIGNNTKIGSKSEVLDSVIGKNVVIGENVTIKNSIIFSDCVIKDSCVIENSIVNSKNVIEAKTSLNECYTESNLSIPNEEYSSSRLTNDPDAEEPALAVTKNEDFVKYNLEDQDLLYVIDKQNHESFIDEDIEEDFSSSEKEEEEEVDELGI